jgi:hypothetical protein
LLPHTYVDANTSICLFARDEDRNDRDYSVTVDAVRQLLDNAGIAQPIEVLVNTILQLMFHFAFLYAFIRFEGVVMTTVGFVMLKLVCS